MSVPAHLNTTPHIPYQTLQWRPADTLTTPHPPVYAGVGSGEQDGLLPAEWCTKKAVMDTRWLELNPKTAALTIQLFVF